MQNKEISNFTNNSGVSIPRQRLFVKLENAERGYYSILWSQANPDEETQISGRDVVPFLRRSGLSREVLRKIWLIASSDNETLDRDEFYVCLRLIAYAQNNIEVSKENVICNMKAPLPKLAAPESTQEKRLDEPTNQEQKNEVAKEVGQSRSDSLNSTGAKDGGYSFGGITETIYDIPDDRLKKYEGFFDSIDVQKKGLITGLEAKELFSRSNLPREALFIIWNLCDPETKGCLDRAEFIVAVHLMALVKNGMEVPRTMPAPLEGFLRDFKKTLPSKNMLVAKWVASQKKPAEPEQPVKKINTVNTTQITHIEPEKPILTQPKVAVETKPEPPTQTMNFGFSALSTNELTKKEPPVQREQIKRDSGKFETFERTDSKKSTTTLEISASLSKPALQTAAGSKNLEEEINLEIIAQQEQQIQYLKKLNEAQENAFKKLNEENLAFKKRMSDLALKKQELQKQITENSVQITSAFEIQISLKQDYQKEAELLEKELHTLKEVINTSFDKIKEEQKLLLQSKATTRILVSDKENLIKDSGRLAESEGYNLRNRDRADAELDGRGKRAQDVRKEEVKVAEKVSAGSGRPINQKSSKKTEEDDDRDFIKDFKIEFDQDFGGDFKNDFANFGNFDLKPAILEDSLGIFENEKTFYPPRGRANSRQTPPQQQIEPHVNLSSKGQSTAIEINPFDDYPGENAKKTVPTKKSEPVSSFDQAWDDDPFQAKPAPKKKIDYTAFTTFSSF